MSISAVNDSKVDLPNTLEVQNDQMIFAAAFPHIAENLTEIVIGSGIGILAFKANYVVLPILCGLMVTTASIALISAFVIMRNSKNSMEFNEVMDKTIHKINAAAAIIGGIALAAYCL